MNAENQKRQNQQEIQESRNVSDPADKTLKPSVTNVKYSKAALEKSNKKQFSTPETTELSSSNGMSITLKMRHNWVQQKLLGPSKESVKRKQGLPKLLVVFMVNRF